MTIGANGKVTSSAAEPTPATKALDACVTRELGALVFAAGAELVVNYPFVFKPSDVPKKPAGGKAPTVDLALVAKFNEAAELARAGKHAEALARYRSALADQKAKKLVASPAFISTLHLQISYELIDLGKLAEAEKEIGLVDKYVLKGEKLYDYHFTLGNVYGGQGKLKPMFAQLVEAISVSEDLDDYDKRPAVCWTQAIKFTMKAKDWAYLKEISEKALQAAQLRGMKDLEVKASVALSEAKKNLAR